MAEGVGAILAAALGRSVGEVSVRQFTGGASRQVYGVEAGSVRAVLRRDPPGHGDADRMRAEAACLRAAAAAGVPVPAVLAAGDTAPGIDAPYLLMEYVDGESIPRKLQRDPAYAPVRERLAGDLGEILGRIHRTPTDTLTMLTDADPLDEIERVYRDLDQPRPAVEMGLLWLRDHLPVVRPKTLVHGDFRLGNFLIAPTGVRAVLDWELAHLGNPMEDLGWLCVRAWRFGGPAPVAGIGTRTQLLDGYERITGIRPTAEELHWWEAFGTLKWLILSMFQADRHFSGREHSLELAAIGRRVCESEYDLLIALDLFDHSVDLAPHPAPTDAEAREITVETPATTVHDRPTLDEILTLVTETLTTDIAPTLAPRERYLLRVCTTLLSTATRELHSGPTPTTTVQTLLTTLGCDSEQTLATHLHNGTLPYTDPQVRRTTSTAIKTRLQITNPHHLTHPSRTPYPNPHPL
ncbi:phosphotransferase family protein [Nocardia sp. NPDC003482]